MLALSGSDVHAWVVRLGDVGLDHAAALSLLSDEERGRLARFCSPLHGRRYALAHGFVRTLLARYLDADPRALTFERGRGGKPRLAGDHTLFFNLSHSEDVVAVAVTRVGEIGIDVEVERDIPDARAIAGTLMSEADLASFERRHPTARSRAFLEWWTRREAAAKATGVGIADLGRSASSVGVVARQLETRAGCVAAIAQVEPCVVSAPTGPEHERSAHRAGAPKLGRRP